MSKGKVVSIDQFKKQSEGRKGQSIAATGSDDFEELTKAGKAFRERFFETLAKMESEFNAQLAKAEKASDVKVKINISAILKRAQASPLTAYSDLHRELVSTKVEEANRRCEQAVKAKFKVIKSRPTLDSLQKTLAQERAAHAAELSRLASQKMTEYLQLVGRK